MYIPLVLFYKEWLTIISQSLLLLTAGYIWSSETVEPEVGTVWKESRRYRRAAERSKASGEQHIWTKNTVGQRWEGTARSKYGDFHESA